MRQQLIVGVAMTTSHLFLRHTTNQFLFYCCLRGGGMQQHANPNPHVLFVCGWYYGGVSFFFWWGGGATATKTLSRGECAVGNKEQSRMNEYWGSIWYQRVTPSRGSQTTAITHPVTRYPHKITCRSCPRPDHVNKYEMSNTYKLKHLKYR